MLEGPAGSLFPYSPPFLFFASLFACRESAAWLADDFGSRFSAFSRARLRRVAPRSPLHPGVLRYTRPPHVHRRKTEIEAFRECIRNRHESKRARICLTSLSRSGLSKTIAHPQNSIPKAQHSLSPICPNAHGGERYGKSRRIT